MTSRSIGSFRIVSELGSGGMGTVHEAVSDVASFGAAPGQRVALKVVHPQLLGNPEFVERLKREADIGSRVDHPNVVRTLGAGTADHDGRPTHFLVMEYVEGETLRGLLEELGRVPEGLCRHIGREVARGLAAIHAVGAIHRDVKPENVLVTPAHDVKVMDLGVARLADEVVRLSQTGAFVGSLHYAAPEQFDLDTEEPDHRADLYALGLLLYELSVGRHPFHDADVREALRHILHEQPARAGVVNPQLTPFFEEVVHTLLDKAPAGRFPDADTVAAVLAEGEGSAWWRDRARVLRERTQRPLRRIRIPRETPLHGRTAELGQLDERFERAKSGDGQVVLLVGEAGIGKSRLVDAFHQRLHERGEEVHFLFGAYPPGGAATGAGAFSTAYREHFGSDGLEQTLATHLTECPRLVPAFAAILRGDPPPAGELPLTPDSLHTVFVHATRNLARERPLVIAIDDLQFTPQEGRALFAALALAVPGHRVLLLGTGRTTLPESWVTDLERRIGALRIRLDRLGAKDLVSLLVDAFRSDRLAHALAGEIAIKSDGNPFFVFEIIRELREGGLIARSADGSWVQTQVIQNIRIPSSLLELIQVRLGEVDSDDRDMLDLAACLGQVFDPLLLAAVLGLGQIPAMKRLARIERRHRLVRSVGRSFEFDHQQVREVLYRAMPVLLREPYHAEIAAVLEQRANEREVVPGALAVDLCEHALAGRVGERALGHLDGALRHLADGQLQEDAATLATRALEEPDLVTGEDRLRLLLETATRFEALGRATDEGRLADEAVRLAETPIWVARAWNRLGWHQCRTGNLAEAEVSLARALEAARDAGSVRTEAVILGTLGKLEFRAGRLRDAQAHHEQALALACATGDRQDEAAAVGALGNVFAARGRVAEARVLFERWEALAREIGQRRGEAIACGNLGNLLFDRGYNDLAQERYERRLALAREDGDRSGQAVALDALGLLAVRFGELSAGQEMLETALRLAREIGVPRLESYALAGLGVASEAAGDLEEARTWHMRALEVRREIDYGPGIASALGDLGRLAAASGDEAEARALLEESLELASEMDTPSTAVLAASALARFSAADAERAEGLLTAQDEWLGRKARLVAHFDLFQATGDSAHLEAAWEALGVLRDRVGEERRDAFMRANPLYRRLAAAAAGHGLT